MLLVVNSVPATSNSSTGTKVISGVACQGRPIKEDDLKALGQQVEERSCSNV